MSLYFSNLNENNVSRLILHSDVVLPLQLQHVVFFCSELYALGLNRSQFILARYYRYDEPFSIEQYTLLAGTTTSLVKHLPLRKEWLNNYIISYQIACKTMLANKAYN